MNQTNTEFEYIIVDGKSEDKTLDIIEKYKKKFAEKKIMITLISEEDEGLYDAMNKGIKIANGEIIGILNSDDFYNIETIERVKTIFQENNEIDILHGNINIIFKDKIVEAKPFAEKELLNGKMAVLHPSVFIKKNVYKKIKFNKLNRIASDYEFLLECYIKNYKFKYDRFIYTNFRANGISYQNPILGWSEVKKIALSKKETKSGKVWINYYKNIIIYNIIKLIRR